MTRETRLWTDRDTQVVVGNLLRAGVVIAAVVGVIGSVLFLVQHGGEVGDFRAFRSEPGELRSVAGVVGATVAGSSRALMQLAILLLIATPVARVGLSLVAFWRERDRRYVAITGLVLALLLVILFSGGL